VKKGERGKLSLTKPCQATPVSEKGVN